MTPAGVRDPEPRPDLAAALREALTDLRYETLAVLGNDDADPITAALAERIDSIAREALKAAALTPTEDPTP